MKRAYHLKDSLFMFLAEHLFIDTYETLGKEFGKYKHETNFE
jgi:hypothetical protein